MNETELVVAAGDNIYFVDTEAKKENPRTEKKILVTERPGPITALAFQQDNLFDAWYNNREDEAKGVIQDTIVETPKPIALREQAITAIDTHSGYMLDLSGTEISATWKNIPLVKGRQEISDLASDGKKLFYCSKNSVYQFIRKTEVKELVRRDGPIQKIHLHNGRLIDAMGGEIRSTLENIVVAERKDPVTLFESHGKVLYDATGNEIFHTRSGNKVAKREHPVRTMHVHEGQLLDASGNSIYDTLNDKNGKKPLWTFPFPVSAIISIPAKRWFEMMYDQKCIFGRGIYAMLKEQFEK